MLENTISLFGILFHVIMLLFLLCYGIFLFLVLKTGFMGNIVWLASYPKSGNTWLRILLANYLNDGVEPLPFERLEEYCVGDMNALPYSECVGRNMAYCSLGQLKKHRLKVQRYMASKIDGTLLVKTHANFSFKDKSPAIAQDVTRGAICIVRNPLDVVTSFADHYGLSLDQAIEASHQKNHVIPGNEHTVPQYLGNWGDHVTSWLDSGDMYRLILRYEDMKRDIYRAFEMVLSFLKLETDKDRMDKAISFSRFEALQEQESKTGFEEKSVHSSKFFRSGKSGGWRELLNDEQVSRLVGYHGNVMQRLGYLREDGSIV